jgi:hypothetical protein
MTRRVKFATSTASRLPLAELVSNPTPPGQISCEWMPSVAVQLGRDFNRVDSMQIQAKVPCVLSGIITLTAMPSLDSIAYVLE